jgi:3-oxoacyl-[acyl-carrier-protein] synthase II
MDKRVVVTGVGIVSPLGLSAKLNWDALINGQCGIAPITHFSPDGFPCKLGGQVPPYKINDNVPKSYRKATKVMARDIEIAVIAADDAFKSAGIQSQAYTDSPTITPARFGCNIGAGLICCELNELTGAMDVARQEAGSTTFDLSKWGTEGMSQLTPLWLLKYLPNMLACHVTIIHGLMGPSNTITCAEASSHLAIGEAFRTIQRGKADLAICGGAESKLNPMGMVRQTLLKRLNATDVQPEESVRPFEKDAAGTVISEGGGLLILEEYEHAKARGANILCELVGFAASQDSYSTTEPDPSGSSYAAAIKNALRDAKTDASEVDLVVPHGLGIASHDAAELAGLSKALNGQLSKAMMSPVKAQWGNLAAGCGADAAIAAMSVAHQVAPPAKGTSSAKLASSLNVSKDARAAKIGVAISTAFSIGGQNAALVFKQI